MLNSVQKHMANVYLPLQFREVEMFREQPGSDKYKHLEYTAYFWKGNVRIYANLVG